MLAHPRVFDLMNQLNHLRRNTDRPMTVDEQAEVLGKIIERQEAEKRAGREAIMANCDAGFDETVMEEAVRALKRQRTDSDSTSKMAGLNDARKVYAYGPEEDPERIDDAMVSLTLDAELLSLSDDFEGEFSAGTLDITDKQDPDDNGPAYVPGFNLLDSICSSIWLATEVGKHLRPRDIVNLFSVSKSFHDIVNQHWQSTIIAWGEHMAPSSLKIFFWKFYGKYAVQDPTGTTWAAPGPFMDRFPRPAWAGPDRTRPGDASVRLVPGLQYLAMIVERETRVRDILACLARSGHRLPRSAHRTLKKVWLLMDVGTNSLRRDFIRNEELWLPEDLYNAQLFLVKLQMRFNEPCFGPDCPALAETLLGSREGLSPLWRLLRGKGYAKDPIEVVQMGARYHCGDGAARRRDGWQDYLGVPAWDLGFDHLEGWGEGHVHLSRPDELVVEEAVRRRLHLQDHLVFMALWGHVDHARRRNLAPAEDEMYMSDDELPPLRAGGKGEGPGGALLAAAKARCGNVPFERGNWTPLHALKARWDSLTAEEKRAVNEADAAAGLKVLPWDDDDEGFFDPDEAAAAGYRLVHDDVCAYEEGAGVCETCGLLRGEEGEEEDEDEMCCCCGSSGGGEGEGEDLGGDIVTPPAAVTDPAVRAVWDKLTPEQKELIADAHKQRQARLKAAAAGAGMAARDPAAAGKALYPRDYKISDPTCLALLRRYDVFPPEMFGPTAGGEEGEEEDGADQSGGSDEGGPEGCGLPGGDEDDDDDSDDDYDNDDDSYGDDEALKALADEEYSDDDEMVFDVNKYKSYLAEAREDGALRRDGPEGEEGRVDGSGEGAAHEADVEGTGAKIPMKMPDTFFC